MGELPHTGRYFNSSPNAFDTKTICQSWIEINPIWTIQQIIKGEQYERIQINHKRRKIKCQKVIEAFEKLNAVPDGAIFADAGKYGFAVILDSYVGKNEDLSFEHSLEVSGIFTESHAFFNKLWESKLFDMQMDFGKENGMEDDDPNDIITALTEDQKKKRIQDLKDALWKESFES